MRSAQALEGKLTSEEQSRILAAMESPELLKLAGAAAEGLIYPTIVDFDIQNPSSAQRQFIDRFHAAHGSDPDWASSHAYDAVIVIADAMRKGGTTGDEIRQEMSAVKDDHFDRRSIDGRSSQA